MSSRTSQCSRLAVLNWTESTAEASFMEGADLLDCWERTFRRHGFKRIAGADEVGRGAIAGPLVAAAVILPSGFDGSGVRDSKALSPARRRDAAERIKQACSHATFRVEAAEVMRLGIDRANHAAIRGSCLALSPTPDYVLIDTFVVADLGCPATGVPHGDAVSLSIAAASIVAKVARDRVLADLHERYPQYGFDRHRGYGTEVHMRALSRFGPTPEHRVSRRLARKLGLAPSD